jgi:hypothetical protein
MIVLAAAALSFMGGLAFGVGCVAWAVFILATGNLFPDFGFGAVDGPGEE